MKKENWIWMPHAAHFILGDRCHFVLATYVGKYIVSTVGELPKYTNEQKGDWEKLGFNRTYETMVFKAQRATENNCHVCPYVVDVQKEVDFEGYNTAKDAYEGHLKLCKKWSEK